MSEERARAYLRSLGMEEKIRILPESTATVELAAKANHVEPGRIAKSLSFAVDGGAILVVAAGDAKINNTKYKAQFGTKAKMLSAEEVKTLVGHEVGGVCPFGINEGVKTYLDISMKRFDSVLPAAGSDNSAVLLSLDELERCAQGFSGWVDVSKLPEEI